MQNAAQESSLCLGRKDDLAQELPVDRAVGVEDPFSKVSDDPFPGGPPRFHQVMGHPVGPMDMAIMVGQYSGDDRFSRGDPPR